MHKGKFSNDITKLATAAQAQERYKLSRTTLMRIAENEGAVRRIGRSVRIDITVLDKAIKEKYA